VHDLVIIETGHIDARFKHEVYIVYLEGAGVLQLLNKLYII